MKTLKSIPRSGKCTTVSGPRSKRASTAGLPGLQKGQDFHTGSQQSNLVGASLSLNRCEKVSTSSAGLGHLGSPFLKNYLLPAISFEPKEEPVGILQLRVQDTFLIKLRNLAWRISPIDSKDTFVLLLTSKKFPLSVPYEDHPYD